MKTVNLPRKPLTVERLERAMAAATYMVTLDGSKAIPIFEKLERALAAMRSDDDALGRAKKLLESYDAAMQSNILRYKVVQTANETL